MKGTLVGLAVGLVVGGAGIGYAATTKVIVAHAGDRVSTPAKVTCGVAKTSVTCTPRSGYFATIGPVGVIVFTNSSKPAVVCVNGSGCRKP